MAKRPGPKGKKSKNRMTGAEVEAANAAHEQQAQATDPHKVAQDVMDQPFTDDGETAAHDDFGHGEVPQPGKMTGEQAAEYSAVEEKLAEGGDVEEEKVDADEKIPNSVVKDKFKTRYIENAKAGGFTGKAAKRSSWDWLAQTIAEQCLVEKEKIDIGRFTDLLDANGVDHSRWTNRNKGWEGRFRMTGRVALQKIVAANGVLKTMTGEVVPPAEWIAKYKAKV